MDERTRTELEAAAFRSLLQHLRQRSDVQNIELMNLAGFCRNCLAKWYAAAGRQRGIEIGYDDARHMVYGMPYQLWREQHQQRASAEQQRKFEETKPLHAVISGDES
jgi:uncharacterized protein